MQLAVPLALALLAFLAFAARRTLTYLRIFQQEEYDSRRFLRWLVRARAVDTRASLGVLLAFAVSFASSGCAICIATLETPK